MTIDWSKFSMENKQEKQWSPPLRERSMEEVSRRLAVSSRIHPSYLLMAYGYLTERKGIKPDDINSISDLVYKAVCDYLNEMRADGETIPDPDVALDFLIDKGWVSPLNKENRSAFTKIRYNKSMMQQRIAEGSATLKEQYEYYKDRDPERAEQIMQQMTEEFRLSLETDTQEVEQSQNTNKQNNSEEIVTSENRSGYEQQQPEEKDGIATLDYLDSVKTKEEEN